MVHEMDATLARRSIGAMFFAAFGGAWIAFWAYRAFGQNLLAVGLAVLGTAVLFLLCYRRYRGHRGVLQSLQDRAGQKRVQRRFYLVNAVQWVALMLVANVLVANGLERWVIPAIIGIIGLHFVPLARLFANPYHYLTGAALILVAGAYPFLAREGPDSPIGCLGAGLILWASAIWALRTTAAKTGVGPA